MKKIVENGGPRKKINLGILPIASPPLRCRRLPPKTKMIPLLIDAGGNATDNTTNESENDTTPNHPHHVGRKRWIDKNGRQTLPPEIRWKKCGNDERNENYWNDNDKRRCLPHLQAIQGIKISTILD
jgi:hypothetical protein